MTTKTKPSFQLDSDSDDDFVTIGTGLPPIEDDEPLKKPTTLQDLTARDKQGRRRFHGAFTGGFSAGYFNSVGTKEGFTPSTFTSSRSNRHGGLQDKPEDFMDEEDMEDHGIAPRKYVTHGSFTSEERKRKREEDHLAGQADSAVSFGTTLLDLVVPYDLPIGMKLLRKMGWREGQGIGPRRTRRKKKAKKKSPETIGVKVYGCARPPSEDSDSDNFVPINFSDVTFAPQDISPMPLKVKDNLHGLGYHGMDPGKALASGSRFSLFSSKPLTAGGTSKKGIRGQAFGVGAFEDEDEDIYSVDNMSNYDLTMQDDSEVDTNFGWTAPRQHGKQAVPVHYVGKLLEGFCLSSKPLTQKKKHPKPDLPRHFRPMHWFRKKRLTSHIPPDVTDSAHQGGGDSRKASLSAVDRGLLLGETPVMESVFDLVPQADKDRIAATKEAIAMTKSLSRPVDDLTSPSQSQPMKENDTPAALPSKFKPAETSLVPISDSSTPSLPQTESKSLFSGSISIQPFRRDPAKQRRYDQYLALVKQSHHDPFTAVCVPSMTEWEKSRERDEFAKAAKLFRPMSAMMSSRFVTGGAMIDDTTEVAANTEPEKSEPMKAAEMKMFGRLTRSEAEWHPDKTLCKRFNVPHPYPGSDIVGVPSVKRDKYSVFNFLSVADYQPKEDVPEPREKLEKPKENHREPKMRDAARGKQRKSLASLFDVLDDPKFSKPGVFSQDGKATDDSPRNANPKDTSSHERLSISSTPSSREEEKCTPAKDEEQVPTTENLDSDEDSGSKEEPTQDLFRAIFKNSDSEDSESESEEKKSRVEISEEVEEEERETTQNQSSLQVSHLQEDLGLGSKPEVPHSSGIPEQKHETEGMDNLFTAAHQEQEKESPSRLTLTQEAERNEMEEEDTYGPKPPPMLTSPSPPGVSRIPCHDPIEAVKKKDRKKHKQHKHKRERKEKKKKSKKRKKAKKASKHRSSKTARCDKDDSSDSWTTDNSDSDVSGDELLERLRQAQASKESRSKR